MVKWDNKTIAEAAGLLNWLEDEEFVTFLSFFHRVMPQVDILYGNLQKREISVDEVASTLTKFTKKINRIRGDVDQMIPDEPEAEAGPPRRRAKLSKATIRAACKEACDLMITQATDRFSSVDHLIPFQLVDPRLFRTFSVTFPTQHFDAVAERFPMIALDKLRTELEVLYGSAEFYTAKISLQLLQCIHENHLTGAFSETFKLLEIDATTPLTSSESERCFSTLKRIKTYSRNTMTNDRLHALAMLSIHKELIRRLACLTSMIVSLPSLLK